MNNRAWRELRQRAERLGVQTAFTDVAGRKQLATPAALQALIPLLEHEATTPSFVEPVIVCWDGKSRSIRANGRRLRAFVVTEEGSKTQELPLRAETDDAANFRIPPLPLGYHQLLVSCGRHVQCVLIISAPRQAFTQGHMREWGIFAPMYAAHSKTSWGAGNLSDWQALCDHVADAGGKVVATLPLMGAFLDQWKNEPSPYSPATRLFWNEFYLDLARVPELGQSASARRIVNSQSFQRAITNLRQQPLVDYAREMALKRQVLEKLAEEFFRHAASPRFREFEKFIHRHPELKRYATFRAACEKQKNSWHLWTARLRDGAFRSSDYELCAQRYHLFAQWLVQEQFDAVLARCRERGVKFYLDLPLGVNPDGYDVWANQALFVNGASVGAPPDAFFTKGQNWGFPPLHPQRIREAGYRYVIDYLRFQMRHTGLLRLDHVMGLHRLWWVPNGASAADGAYVSYRPEEWYAILNLESHRHRTVLIGENLGTVPPAVNRAMQQHGLRTMYVVPFEIRPASKSVLREPPRHCVASLNTHDMPTFAAFWRGLDIRDRRDLGLLTEAEVREETKCRAELRLALKKFLQQQIKPRRRLTSARQVLAELLRFLARSEAELVLVNFEDLWLECDPQNTPGTCGERVNWRRKFRVTLDDALRFIVRFQKNFGRQSSG